MSEMEKALDKFLNFLCVEWGFCIPPEDRNKFMATKYFEANEFAKLLLEAEGMDPDLDIEWRRKIRNEFTSRFGSELSEDNSNEPNQK
jgi:hypothetical protein